MNALLSAGDANLSWDANGNLTGCTGSCNASFTWDGENRLVGVARLTISWLSRLIRSWRTSGSGLAAIGGQRRRAQDLVKKSVGGGVDVQGILGMVCQEIAFRVNRQGPRKIKHMEN